jgi:hypothetical protein
MFHIVPFGNPGIQAGRAEGRKYKDSLILRVKFH